MNQTWHQGDRGRTHTHELINRTPDVPYKLLESNRVAIRRLVPRLELAFPFSVTGPLRTRGDEHDEWEKIYHRKMYSHSSEYEQTSVHPRSPVVQSR